MSVREAVRRVAGMVTALTLALSKRVSQAFRGRVAVRVKLSFLGPGSRADAEGGLDVEVGFRQDAGPEGGDQPVIEPPNRSS